MSSEMTLLFKSLLQQVNEKFKFHVTQNFVITKLEDIFNLNLVLATHRNNRLVYKTMNVDELINIFVHKQARNARRFYLI